MPFPSPSDRAIACSLSPWAYFKRYKPRILRIDNLSVGIVTPGCFNSQNPCVRAKQHIVCALMQGPEAHYGLGEAVARAIFAPVLRAHRCTVEAIAILEPALSETIGATFAMTLRAATDMAVNKGVPAEAARDFILGHLNIELAIAFDEFPGGKFSDGALLAIEEAGPKIFQDKWMERAFDEDEVLRSVRAICE